MNKIILGEVTAEQADYLTRKVGQAIREVLSAHVEGDIRYALFVVNPPGEKGALSISNMSDDTLAPTIIQLLASMLVHQTYSVDVDLRPDPRRN